MRSARSARAEEKIRSNTNYTIRTCSEGRPPQFEYDWGTRCTGSQGETGADHGSSTTAIVGGAVPIPRRACAQSDASDKDRTCGAGIHRGFTGPGFGLSREQRTTRGTTGSTELKMRLA